MKTIFALLLLCCSICNGQHRKHVLGSTFLTSPPWYSCVYCNREISPYQFLPKAYDTMKLPMYFGDSSEFIGYVNGYYKFIDSLEKHGISDSYYFMEKWNESDTSCISSEVALHKSENVWQRWLKTHKPGIYWLNKEDWMSTNGFMGHNSKKSTYAMGGRFSDKILLADKWYKIVYKLPSSLLDSFEITK